MLLSKNAALLMIEFIVLAVLVLLWYLGFFNFF